MKNVTNYIIITTLFVLSGCAHPATDGYQFGSYSEAEKYYAQGKYQKAIGSYEEYLAENPKGHSVAIAEYYMAKSYTALGKNEEAKVIYESVIEKYPDLVWAEFAQEQLNTFSA